MGVLTLKEGDTRKAAWRVNFSLLNASVDLKVQAPNGDAITTAPDVEIADPYAGIVTWDHGGNLVPGTYQVELWVHRDSETFKAPTEGYETLRITPDLMV